MTKIVRPTHIIGERGVIAFANYCNRHKPYIIFREVTKNDFGIDGEVELTIINADGKTEPTADILKVQIKSTEHDASYMQREKEDTFSFLARPEDLEYWKKHRQYGINVLLVIYDGRGDQEKLYCKQITDLDEALSTPKGKQRAKPIEFGKVDHLLEVGKNNFIDIYSKAFRSRVNYNANETLISNMWAFRQKPSSFYVYPTHCKTKKAVFEKVTNAQAPFFVIYNSLIYTFSPLEKDFKEFYENIVSEGQKRTDYNYNEVVDNLNLRNHYVELLNEYIKAFMFSRHLSYQKDFRRYYFYLKADNDEYAVPYRTRRREEESKKTVVKRYTYGADTFFRHLAVELKPLFVESQIYLVVTPKYYFSEDRKNPYDPKKTTKYTNWLNSRTWNDGVLDQLHFWLEYLSKGSDEIVLFDGVTLKRHSITVGRPVTFTVPYGIPLEGDKVTKSKKSIKKQVVNTQTNLFS